MMRVDLESRLKAIDRQIERSEREAKTASEKTDAAIRRMDKAELRMEKFDRRLEATGKIIQFGMKMLAESQQRHKEMDFKINALIAAQMRSEEQNAQHKREVKEFLARFDRFLKGRGNGSANGHKR